MNQDYKDRLHAISQELLLHTAAPELLVALQYALERLEVAQMEQRCDHKPFDSNAHDLAIEMARAAIAKATGK